MKLCFCSALSDSDASQFLDGCDKHNLFERLRRKELRQLTLDLAKVTCSQSDGANVKLTKEMVLTMVCVR